MNKMSIRNICIFGCGNYGKLLYSSVKCWDAEIHCAFCDNDSEKYNNPTYEIISPQMAAERLKSKELDAIAIPGAYRVEFQIAMVFQLAKIGVDVNSVFIAVKDIFGENNSFEVDCLKRLDEVPYNSVFSYFTYSSMKETFLLTPIIRNEIDRLIINNDIDGKRRILVCYKAILAGGKNGDAWYFLTRVPIYECDNDCKLVILVNKNTADTVYYRARFLEYEGYEFEFVAFSNETIAHILTTFNNGFHVGVFFETFETSKFRVIYTAKTSLFARYFVNSNSENRYQEVRRPRFSGFNRQYYIDAYSIDPGKTFWIVPESNWAKPFPLSYWNAMAAVLRNFDYTVVFNSKDPNCSGSLAFIPWEDVIGFAELCGYVIGTRSGFFDFAIIANAQFFIFTPPPFSNVRVEDIFNVDNSDGHIRTIPMGIPRGVVGNQGI